MTSTARERFIALLQRDILEIDAAELDFGIYRVLNHRRAAVERFIGEELPARIDAALASLPGSAGEDEQSRIYNALHTFFARYYDSGDFLPRQRRGKAGRYSVPYDGSDTHFHWATKGSHYVKSGERFAGYAYTQPDGTRVRLAVAAASVERDNVKGAQRHYVPQAVEPPGEAHPGEWRLVFEYRPLAEDEAKAYGGARKARGAAAQEADDDDGGGDTPAAEGASVQERIVNAWFAAGKPKLPKALDAALLQRHALRYARGRSTDFFVHPQLGRFLQGELDHYLRAEFVNLWDLPDAALARERGKLAIARDIGRAIIDVLAALEDLQAALFEKRKFVLAAHYLVQCSWLARQGAAGAALVQRAAAHAPQAARWRQWLGEAEGSGAGGAELLARCPHLPLDTALFDAAFQWEVLAAVPDLQAALGGVLVHGDNYAALRTLQAQWRAAVKCIYIDPPYNTGNDGFLYKDDYTRHAAWASMMQGRAAAGMQLVGDGGVQFTSIDENEHRRWLSVAETAIGDDTFVANVIWQKNYSPKNTAQHFSEDHDYVTVHAASPATWRPGLLERTDQQDAAFTNPDNDPRGPWKASDLSARNFYSEGTYPITTPGGRVIDGPPAGNFWRVSHHRLEQLDADKRIWWGVDGNNVPALKRFLSEVMQGRVPQTLWLHKDVGHTQDGKRTLLSMMALESGDAVFNTLKPVPLIERCIRIGQGDLTLDYFAGSGTTAHAVINLNRDDGGSRRFILVEQGEYFDTVTLPRVAKVMACPEWKDGKPKQGVQHDAGAAPDPDAHWSRRTLPVVQVLRIERYEDSLDALALPGATAEGGGSGQGELPGFDALLRYVAGVQGASNPVRLSTAALARPFDYRLPTVWEGRAAERPVDLLHTTLALLGLHLLRVKRVARPAAAGGGAAVLAEVRPHRHGQDTASVPTELLLLRDHDVDELPPAELAARAEAEYRWLADAVYGAFGRALADYACVHHNRDLLLPGAGENGASIDAALAAAMWQRDPAFSPAD